MARFKYLMQNVLNLKIKLEDQARIELGNATAELNRLEAELEALKQRKIDYLDEGRKLLSGSLNVKDLEENKRAIEIMDTFIVDAFTKVALAEKEVERARIKLTGCIQERKVQERLREKAFQEFLLEENRAESKVVDEITSYAYSAKR